MADALLTFHCADMDADVLVAALRGVTTVPIHVRSETVHGRDFGDADTQERVTGTLRRTAIELVVDEGEAAALVEAARGSRRRLPFRWRAVPVLRHGRIA